MTAVAAPAAVAVVPAATMAAVESQLLKGSNQSNFSALKDIVESPTNQQVVTSLQADRVLALLLLHREPHVKNLVLKTLLVSKAGFGSTKNKSKVF